MECNVTPVLAETGRGRKGWDGTERNAEGVAIPHTETYTSHRMNNDMVSTFSIVWIDKVRLPIVLVVS